MPDQQQHFTVMVRVAYALWPGDGTFVIRVSGPHFPDQFVLVDRDGRHHDLAPYTFGMMLGRRER